jgi:hypothetical protein
MVGRTARPEYQPVTRPLLTQDNTDIGRNKIYIRDFTGTLFCESNVRVGKSISCLDDMATVVKLRILRNISIS